MILLTACSSMAGVLAQSLNGNWAGHLNLPGIKLPLTLHILEKGDSLSATLDSPAQGSFGIPADRTRRDSGRLTFEILKLGASYDGTIHTDSINGTFSQKGTKFPLTFFKAGKEKASTMKRPQTPVPPFPYSIEEVSFTNPSENNTLAGTLTTPKGKTNFPLVVMITGSGAQDRDETLFGHKPFWVIADHFTRNGIGVLRLDDRGVGGSAKGKEGATSADFATDISAAVNYLNNRGFHDIGLVGHSEGGMIAPMVATQNKLVKFIVLLAGPGIPNKDLMELQTEAVARASGSSASAVAKNLSLSKEIYKMLINYKGKDLQGEVRKLMDKGSSEIGQLPESQRKEFIDQQLKMITSPWFLYFIRFDPQVNLRKTRIPVLALNGSLDVQVTSKENLAGIEKSLRAARNKNFKVLELPGLNHLFQQAKTGAPVEYAQIEQTISPEVLDIMTRWILSIKSH